LVRADARAERVVPPPQPRPRDPRALPRRRRHPPGRRRPRRRELGDGDVPDDRRGPRRVSGAVREASAVLARRSRSFALAGRLLPPAARTRAVVLYAWCRRVDDAVDDAPPGARAGAVTRLAAEVDALYAGRPPADDPLGAAF